jgi:hypothetical protein
VRRYGLWPDHGSSLPTLYCRSAFWSLLLLLLVGARGRCSVPSYPPNPASVVKAQDKKIAAQWLSATLAHGGTLPFSFDYDGKPSSGFLSSWPHQHTSTKLDAQQTREEYIYTDPATKLTVRCEAIRYSDFPAVEWTVYFVNHGAADTPIIANIQALDLNLNAVKPGDYTLHFSSGSHAGPDDYQPHEVALTPGKDLPLGGNRCRLAGKLEVALHAG